MSFGCLNHESLPHPQIGHRKGHVREVGELRLGQDEGACCHPHIVRPLSGMSISRAAWARSGRRRVRHFSQVHVKYAHHKEASKNNLSATIMRGIPTDYAASLRTWASTVSGAEAASP